jgi:hypothetical protein
MSETRLPLTERGEFIRDIQTMIIEGHFGSVIKRVQEYEMMLRVRHLGEFMKNRDSRGG